jgi:hypothetical protein
MSLPELRLESILAAARHETWLEELGDTGFAGRLRTIVDVMADHPDLQTDEARAAAAANLVDITAKRLRFEADRRAHPQIGDEPIVRPIIVAGTPRSGTSLLHSLLACDAHGRAPRAWEVFAPSPPPSLAQDTASRRASARTLIEQYCLRAPGAMIAHPYWDEWDEALMECEALVTLDLHNAYAPWFTQTPAGLDLGGGNVPGLGDLPGTYRFHRAMLQQLQFGAPPHHWVLKGNSHPFGLDALRATYPDAEVIWLHRHPTATFASMMELMTILREGRSGRPVDRRQVGPLFLERYASSIEAGMASPQVDHPRMLHLRYRELRRGPGTAIEQVYAHFARSFTAEHEQAIDTWLGSPGNRANRRGTFHYDLAWFGLTRKDINERFAAYIDRFDLSEEED